MKNNNKCLHSKIRSQVLCLCYYICRNNIKNFEKIKTIAMHFETSFVENSLLKKSKIISEDEHTVEGNNCKSKILQSYLFSGFQATNFGLAVNEINRMLKARDVQLQEQDEDLYEDDDFIRKKNSCTIFLAYNTQAGNLNLKQSVKFLVQNKLIDCLVTTTGANIFD